MSPAFEPAERQRHIAAEVERADAPIRVLHVWDRRTANGQRDLHWGLQHHGVTSVQCVRSLCAVAGHQMADTFAVRTMAPNAPGGGLLQRIEARAWRLGWFRFERFVAQHAARVRPDVINAHFGTTGWKISGLAQRLGIPLVVNFYGVDVSAIIREPQWQRRYAELFARASCLVVLCDAAAERLFALGCAASKVRIWNHPLDLQAYTYRPHAPRRPVRLLIGARFVEKKGYPFLLDACAQLIRDGRDLTLTAVGYGPGSVQVRAQAARLGLGDRFTLHDTKDVPEFDRFYAAVLQQHDIFVLPSTTAKSGDDEGGPALSLVLAQAAGLPVICTPFPGSERSVTDGETGLLCPQDDAAALAARIACLMDRPELGHQLAVRANTLVRDRFGLDTQAVAMATIYREAMHRA